VGANGGYQGGYHGFQGELGQGAPKGTLVPLTRNPPPPLPPLGGLPLLEGPPPPLKGPFPFLVVLLTHPQTP